MVGKCHQFNKMGLQNILVTFFDWWNTVMEAEKRLGGQSHIELITNILWRIWKVRNAWQFNSKLKHPLKIVQRVQKDWQEQVLAKERREQMSTVETSRVTKEVDQAQDEAYVMNLKLAIYEDKDTKWLGSGIIARKESHGTSSDSLDNEGQRNKHTSLGFSWNSMTSFDKGQRKAMARTYGPYPSQAASDFVDAQEN